MCVCVDNSPQVLAMWDVGLDGMCSVFACVRVCMCVFALLYSGHCGLSVAEVYYMSPRDTARIISASIAAHR